MAHTETEETTPALNECTKSPESQFSAVSQRVVTANGLAVPILEAGRGPLVVCLHGFPDHARTWAPILNRLAEAGYWAVAPAQRGYWPGGAAPDHSYRASSCGQDLLALIDALGRDDADVVGHDLGARAAYAAASLDPARVRRLVGMAVPHGPQLTTAFIADGDQQRRSWYMFFFQTSLAEQAVPLDDFAFIDRLWTEWSPGYERPISERQALKRTLGQPGVFTETLNYYRQLFSPPPDQTAHDLDRRASAPITVPSLYLHGREDGCMSAELSDGMEMLFPGGLQRLVVPTVGHFLHVEQPDVITNHIVTFLKGNGLDD